jgi:ATPase family AAA domain-containing protein 2
MSAADLFADDDNLEDTSPRAPTLSSSPLTIKIPGHPSRMAVGSTNNLRRSSRRRSGSGEGPPSGSEYQGSERSMQNDEVMGDEEEEEEEVKPVYNRSSRGRSYVKKSYAESQSEPDDDALEPGPSQGRKTRSTRPRTVDDDEEEEHQPRRRTTRSSAMNGFIASDDDELPDQTGSYGISLRLRKRPSRSDKQPPANTEKDRAKEQAAGRAARASRRHQKREEVDDYHPQNHTSSPTSADADGSTDEEHQGGDDEDELDLAIDMNDNPVEEEEEEPETDGKPYSLRQRQKVNYAIPPPLEEMVKPPMKPSKSAFNRKGPNTRRKGPGWSASGAELGRWMGLPGDDSVCPLMELIFT